MAEYLASGRSLHPVNRQLTGARTPIFSAPAGPAALFTPIQGGSNKKRRSHRPVLVFPPFIWTSSPGISTWEKGFIRATWRTLFSWLSVIHNVGELQAQGHHNLSVGETVVVVKGHRN